MGSDGGRSSVIAKSPGFGPFRAPCPMPFPFDDHRTCLTANGRTAIWAGLSALALPKGGRVLVPAWHCGSEIDAILAAGGKPVPYRLRHDLSADLDHVAALLAQGAAAVYVIHYFGKPQPVAELAALAHSAGALLVEDLALGLLSVGADGLPLGQGGDMTVFSLVKSLSVPDGGALWLRDAVSRARLAAPSLRHTLGGLRSLWLNSRRPSVRDRTAGQDGAALDAWTSEGGFAPDAPRMRASGATRALIRVTDFARLRRSRQANWPALAKALPDRPDLHPLIKDLPDGACPAYFPLWAADPDRALAQLAAEGVEAVRFWRRFHPAIDLSDFPEIAKLKRHVLRLPVHCNIDAAAINRIAAACARSPRAE